MPAGLAIGGATALVLTILGAMIVAKLVDSEVIEEAAIGYGAAVVLLAASFMSSMAAWSRIKRQRALVCMASGGIYFLMLLAMTALFFGGQYSGVGVTAILIAGGSGCAVLLGLRGGGGKRGTRYKIPKH